MNISAKSFITAIAVIFVLMYGNWVKWTWKFQGLNLVLTSLLLMLGLMVGY